MVLKNLKIRYKKFLNSFEKESKVYILPSRFGLFYIVVTFISFVFSLSFGHPLSYFFSIILLVFFVMIAFLTNNYMKGVDIKREESVFLPEGKAELRLSFYHTSSVPAYFQVQILDHDYLVKRFESSLHLDLNDWGLMKNVNIKVSSVYPFFLFKSWKNICLIKNLYIIPSFDKDILGDSDNEEIELRNYIYGDNFSRVNWKRSTEDKQLVVQRIDASQFNHIGKNAVFDLVESRLEKDFAYNYLGELFFYINNRWVIRSPRGSEYTREQLRSNFLLHMESLLYGN